MTKESCGTKPHNMRVIRSYDNVSKCPLHSCMYIIESVTVCMNMLFKYCNMIGATSDNSGVTRPVMHWWPDFHVRQGFKVRILFNIINPQCKHNTSLVPQALITPATNIVYWHHSGALYVLSYRSSCIFETPRSPITHKQQQRPHLTHLQVAL